MTYPSDGIPDESWRVQLFIAVRDGDLGVVKKTVKRFPTAIHERFCDCLGEGMLEWESLNWYEFAEATCLYIASSYCQIGAVRWLLENGVDREKTCYYGQKASDVVGQCRLDGEAAAEIRHALSEGIKKPRPPVAPTCVAKVGYEDIVKKVYETIQVGNGTKKRVPKRVTETVATCKVTVAWPTYWLSDITSSRDGNLGGGVTYELQYRSRVGQDWVLVPTKTPNKILTGLTPRQIYEFRVRALNSAGWGEFSPTTDMQMPSGCKKGGDKGLEAMK